MRIKFDPELAGDNFPIVVEVGISGPQCIRIADAEQALVDLQTAIAEYYKNAETASNKWWLGGAR